MALGQRVLYTFDETQAHYVRMRNTNGGFGGLPAVAAGDTFPADIVHDYGDDTADLVVTLRGPGRHFVQNVAEGVSGQQGRWTELPA
ncbi:hypothetical protein V1634_29730 [Plantactinospora veratri]|uniref:Uncharacterized protein n=1 Tax=Plantactinospora veratri TaxID=1436122 RepID=A0ABU7SM37_9ACTN